MRKLWTIHNLWTIHKMHLEENCGQFVNCGSPSDFKKNCGQSTNFVDSSPQKIVDNPQILWTSMQFQAENPPQIPEIFACGAKNTLEIAYSEVKIPKIFAPTAGSACKNVKLSAPIPYCSERTWFYLARRRRGFLFLLRVS